MTLTREAILAMPAGPEMDSWVAELVMQWSKGRTFWHRRDDQESLYGVGYLAPGGKDHDFELFAPSTDIAAAWEVVEKLRADGYCFNIDACEPKQAIEPLVGFMRDGHHINDHYQADRRDWRAFGPVPLAICRAALQTTLTP